MAERQRYVGLLRARAEDLRKTADQLDEIRAALVAEGELAPEDQPACVSPTGRTDCHGVYVRVDAQRRPVCTFCGEPVEKS